MSVGDTLPDLTILLDVPAREGLARARARSAADRFEKDDVATHEARRRAFLAIAKAEPDRIFVIDGTKPEEEIHQDISLIVNAAIISWVSRADTISGLAG